MYKDKYRNLKHVREYKGYEQSSLEDIRYLFDTNKIRWVKNKLYEKKCGAWIPALKIDKPLISKSIYSSECKMDFDGWEKRWNKRNGDALDHRLPGSFECATK